MRLALVALFVVGCAPAASLSSATAPAVSLARSVRVDGQRLTSEGHELVLHGVNLSGSEFRCVQGDGIFEGPDIEALTAGLSSWNINAVRLPLNESCWLGDARLRPEFSGPMYREAIVNRVAQLRKRGWFVIVDLHWSSVGESLATGIAPMPHAQRAPAFWASVARTFRSDLGVIFDLYNEPHISALSADAAWKCWRDGCLIENSAVAGMQMLVDAVRRERAANVVLASGVDWANDASQWSAHRPKDDQLAISFHTYNFNRCSSVSCWNAIPGDVPLVITEFGENDCASTFATNAMAWAASRHASFLAWTWNRWDCRKGPALIEQWDGAPTPYGRGVRDVLRRTWPSSQTWLDELTEPPNDTASRAATLPR